MLTYFNFAVSLEFQGQQELKYLLFHKDKIILKIVLRKGIYIDRNISELNLFLKCRVWNLPSRQ